MNPADMTTKQIIKSLGLTPEDVEAVSIRPNGSGEIILTNRDKDNITWHDEQDFIRLSSKYLTPWLVGNDDISSAKRWLSSLCSETLLEVWRDHSRSVLARIGYREVMKKVDSDRWVSGLWR